MSVAFLFAGQGAQRIGMLHSLPSCSVIEKTIEEAVEILGEDVMSLDTAAALKTTRAVQLSLLIYEVAVTRLLIHKGITPDIVAGHSLGAFAAAVASSALSFSDALVVVNLRGKRMQDAYPSGFGMGAIIGLDASRVSELTNSINSDDLPAYIANINALDQITISGSLFAIEKVFELARAKGAFTTKLIQISVPSHCRLLEDVSKEIAQKLSLINLSTLEIPYVGCYKARILSTPADICQDLSEGMANTIHWYEATELMYERGVRLFMEISPGEVLTNLAKSAFPEARCISAIQIGIESADLLFHKEKSRLP